MKQTNLLSSLTLLLTLPPTSAFHLPLRQRITPILHSTPTDLPFFATPTIPAHPPSSQSSTVTLRLPLGTLFDGRDYVFGTYTNVRGYEWGVKEVGVLVEDLMDAALGSLGGEMRDGAGE